MQGEELEPGEAYHEETILHHLSRIFIANGIGNVLGLFYPFPHHSTTKKNIHNSKLRQLES